MNINKLVFKFDNLFFYLALYIYFPYFLLQGTKFNGYLPNSQLVMLICAILLICEYLKDNKMSIKSFFGFTTLCIFGLYLNFTQDDIAPLLLIILFTIAGRNIEIENIIRPIFKLEMPIWILTIISSKLGLIENGYRVTNSVKRYFLGFTSTSAPILLIFLYLMFIAYKKEKVKRYHLLIFFVLNCYLYNEVRIKATFFYLNLALVATLIIKYYLKSRKIGDYMKRAIPLIPYICAIISIGTALLYSSSSRFWVLMNKLLTGRLKLGHDAISSYGFSLFGQVINWNRNRWLGEYKYVDASYLKYSLMYGVVIVLIIIVCYSNLLKKLIMVDDKYLILSIVITLLYAIFDPQLLYILYNPFIIMLGSNAISKYYSRWKHSTTSGVLDSTN